MDRTVNSFFEWTSYIIPYDLSSGARLDDETTFIFEGCISSLVGSPLGCTLGITLGYHVGRAVGASVVGSATLYDARIYFIPVGDTLGCHVGNAVVGNEVLGEAEASFVGVTVKTSVGLGDIVGDGVAGVGLCDTVGSREG